MASTTIQRRPPRSVVLAAAVGVAVRAHPFVVSGRDRRLTDLDSQGYLDVAGGLPSVLWNPDHPVLSASLRRTPGYPLLLRLLQPWGGEISIVGAAIAGIALSGVGLVVLSWWLGQRLAGPRAGVLAAWLVALDVLLIGFAPYVLTETMFAVVLVGLVIAYDRFLQTPTWRLGAVVGALGASAALIRPVALYMTPWLLLGLALAVGRSGLRAVVRPGAALFVAALLPLGGWYVRNLAVGGVATFTTVEGSNLFEYRAAGVIAEQRGISQAAALEEMEREYRTQLRGTEAEVDEAKRRIGFQIIREHPGDYARATMRGAVSMFTQAGTYEIEQRMPSAVRSVAATPLKLGALLFLLIEYLAALVWGVTTWVASDRRRVLALAAPVAGYLLVAVGPESYARFRVPLQPLLAVLAAVTICHVWDRYRRDRRTPATSRDSSDAPPLGTLHVHE